MFDHLSLAVSNLQQSINFYNVVLAPLGIKCLFNLPYVAAYGVDSPMFWIGNRRESTEISPCSGFHLAFAASDRSSVDAFYVAAMGIGGKENGKPGLRPQYHPNYYAAFVIDPDGYRIEAVCHNRQ
ncbi:MAG: VOC family protein [Spirirestis rafaelensis WJT71-NPBG6]|jgi:catechol 2,3-dioxygenase-like lactoylglutathione lyase family enzyme|nr:VOC family protein [Spirirestis rafaelensis WJT71-NPBG6]